MLPIYPLISFMAWQRLIYVWTTIYVRHLLDGGKEGGPEDRISGLHGVNASPSNQSGT